MADDLVALALRNDAELLMDLAPALDAVALWHRIRTVRAKRIQRIMDGCGWSLRALLATVLTGVATLSPEALPGFIPPLALLAWLSMGICSPMLTFAESSSHRASPV